MSDYRDHAYERTVVAWLQRVMLDRVISSDSPPKEGLVCEEVFRNESDVPQSALHKVFEKLGLWENDQRTKMSTFKFMQEPAPLPFVQTVASATETPTTGPRKKKTKNGTSAKTPRKRKAAEEPEGGGSDT